MAKQLQLRRGTTSQHGSFTGLVGEVTVDTDIFYSRACKILILGRIHGKSQLRQSKTHAEQGNCELFHHSTPYRPACLHTLRLFLERGGCHVIFSLADRFDWHLSRISPVFNSPGVGSSPMAGLHRGHLRRPGMPERSDQMGRPAPNAPCGIGHRKISPQRQKEPVVGSYGMDALPASRV